MPTVVPKKLLQSTAGEHALRFGFGGVVTLLTGLVAHRLGPSIGGLFLAFPAILPAALTLVDEHDGREQAIDDTRGAALGSIGLGAFAFICWRFADSGPPFVVLAGSMLAWMAIGSAAWALTFGRRSQGAHRAGSASSADRAPAHLSRERRSAPARRRGRR